MVESRKEDGWIGAAPPTPRTAGVGALGHGLSHRHAFFVGLLAAVRN